MTELLAQAAGSGVFLGMSFTQIVIGVVIAVAIVIIAVIGCRAMGVQIPAWAAQMFWVVVIAFVAILAILLLVSLWQRAG